MQGLKPLLDRAEQHESRRQPHRVRLAAAGRRHLQRGRGQRRRIWSCWDGTSRCSPAPCWAAPLPTCSRRLRADVGVFVDRGLQQVRKVLVPFQGTPDDKAALELARRMTAGSAEVTILHVIKPGAPKRSAGSPARIRPDFHRRGALQPGQRTHEAREPRQAGRRGDRRGRQGYDLVIVGAGHQWGLERRLFGMAPELMVEQCPTSLLLVRRYSSPRLRVEPWCPRPPRRAS